MQIEQIRAILRALLPTEALHWLHQWRRRRQLSPPVGWVRFGSLRRLQPISDLFGFDRGFCIDRYYIESFLEHYAKDIHGNVLEFGDATYTRKLGGSRVARADVLHAVEGNPNATVIADLTSADHVPSDSFDCIICTQTLHLIYDVPAALRTLYRVLKPTGVLLTTFPGISQISRYDMDRWGDCWRFTTFSTTRLFAEVFPEANLTIQAYGNVLTAIAFLHGLTAEELRQEEMDYHDPDYEVLITVRAEKPGRQL